MRKSFKKAQIALGREKAIRTELGNQLIAEARSKDTLIKKTAQLAVAVGKAKGNEIDFSNQVIHFQQLTTQQLNKINREYQDFLDKLEATGQSEGLSNTLKGLRLQLKDLRDQFDTTDVNSAAFPKLRAEIEALQTKIKDLINTQSEMFAEGTLAALEKQKSALVKEQRTVSDSNASWNEYQGKIDDVTKAIEKLTGVRKKLKDLMEQDASLGGALELPKQEQDELQFGFTDKQQDDQIEKLKKVEEIKTCSS